MRASENTLETGQLWKLNGRTFATSYVIPGKTPPAGEESPLAGRYARVKIAAPYSEMSI
jgi:hypothetical protein